MKLFAIKNERTNQIVPGLFYTNKMVAKDARTELNKTSADNHVVTYGPDHDKFKHKA